MTSVWEIRAEIPVSSAEAAYDLLLESGDGRWSLFEDALARRAWLTGIFPDEHEAIARWSELRTSLPRPPLEEPALRRLDETEWRDGYKAHFHAWTFGRLHWVPAWERPSFRLPPGHAVLWLDPGMAFGTGNHETTRLCIEHLAEMEAHLTIAAKSTLRVVDAGCGSGILALSSALLGFGAIEGFDIDPEAVRVSRENAALNGLGDRVRFFTAALPDGLAGQAAVLMANIQADILVLHASALLGAIAPKGTLILSGILASELSDVRSAFCALAPDWSISSRTEGEWSSLALVR
jgi:ribosomal protein L11 methyltransferase